MRFFTLKEMYKHKYIYTCSGFVLEIEDMKNFELLIFEK